MDHTNELFLIFRFRIKIFIFDQKYSNSVSNINQLNIISVIIHIDKRIICSTMI